MKGMDDGSVDLVIGTHALIQDGVDRGVFADIHPQLVAEVMLAAVGRASHPSFLADTSLSMSEAFAECSRFLRSGLARSDKIRSPVTGLP